MHPRIAIVAADWNEFIVGRLLEGATAALRHHGLPDENIVVVRCPGSFEIPLVAQACAQRADIDAVICLGCVIRGETAHFEYVSSAATNGILRVGLDTGKPCIFGVLTTDTIEQAMARAGDNDDNKGREAAVTALRMLTVLASIHGA